MTWMLVRKEPSPRMLSCGNDALPDKAGEMIHTGAVFRQMLQASEPPTDAELDELCRMMWQHTVSPPEYYSPTYQQRACMRQFLTALNGAKP